VSIRQDLLAQAYRAVQTSNKAVARSFWKERKEKERKTTGCGIWRKTGSSYLFFDLVFGYPYRPTIKCWCKGKVQYLLQRFYGLKTRSAFTVSEVAADWHELMIPQRTMQPSIARVSKHLDLRFAAIRHTTAPISH